MTFSLSTPMKIVLLAGTVLILGAAGGLLILGGHAGTQTTAVVVHPTKTVHVARSHPAHVRAVKHALVLDPTLPIPLRNALRHSKLVVAVVFTPGDPGDKNVLVQAR